MNICLECKYVDVSLGPYNARCRHPNLKLPVDPVTGELLPPVATLQSCEFLRRTNSWLEKVKFRKAPRCGPAGDWYEPKCEQKVLEHFPKWDATEPPADCPPDPEE